MKIQTRNNILWALFAFSATIISLYPLTFLSSESRNSGLLTQKSQELRSSLAYMTSFYIHISFGGIALLTGWSQFLKSWRNKHRTFHRRLGYVYVTSVLISSIAGFIIAFFSTGGTISEFGFGSLAVVWFTTNLLAFMAIKKRKIKEHEKWMMRNYSLTFGAVKLRVYLPILFGLGADVYLALQIVSWISWVPNLVAMEIYIQTYDVRGSSLMAKFKQELEVVSDRESIGS